MFVYKPNTNSTQIELELNLIGYDRCLTGKSFSEALILASTNPQYDKRLFIELHVQYMKIASSEHRENMLCTQIVFGLTFDTYVHNMFYPCSDLAIFMY